MADLYYYESGYFSPELGYFVYTADAASEQTVSSSLSVQAGVIKASAEIAMTVTSSVTATISHIEGADLFAFANATLAAQVQAIRNNNIAATAAFSIATDGKRTRRYSSDEAAQFTIAVSGARTRAVQAAQSAAFSLTTTAGVVKQGQSGSAGRTAKTLTAFGNAVVSTAQKKFGAGSLLLDGTGDYVTVPSTSDFNFGTGDFTLECWIYRNVSGVQHQVFDFRTTNTQAAPLVYINSSNTLLYYVSGATRITGTTVAANTWNHIALSRQGTSTKLFLNGVQVGSTWTDTTNYIQSPLTIGSRWDGALGNLNGYIDDVRITKGVAKYTANFTTPTTALTSDSNTVLLTHLDTDISDDTGSVPGITSAFSLSAVVGILKKSTASFNSQFTTSASTKVNRYAVVYAESSAQLNATISHIEGADLFAFTTATLSAQANIIKNTASSLLSSSQISANGQRIRFALADLQSNSSVYCVPGSMIPPTNFDISCFSNFDVAADINAIYSIDATTTSQSTVDANATRIQQGTANFGALFTPSVDCVVTVNSFAVLDSTSALSAEFNRTRSVDSNLQSIVNFVVDTGIIKPFSIANDSNFVANIEAVKTVTTSIVVDALFTPTVDCVITVNSFAVLESSSQIVINNSRTRNVGSTMNSTVNLTANVNVIDSTGVICLSSFQLVADNRRTQRANADMFASASVQARTGRIIQFSSFENSLFSPNIKINIVVNPFATLNSNASVTANLTRTKRYTSNITSSSSLTINAVVKSGNISQMSSKFDLSATGIRAIRFVGDGAVQGQIITQSGSVLQTDIYPNYGQVKLDQPA